jgi:4-amino-4-deoxy-L-arabinose transferase-like glycosyltransferase
MTFPASTQLARRTALIIVAMMLFRLVAAAYTPLTFDEAYYWTWSKHLAGGFYDHPPAVAFVIAIGTLIAGDTELGVRLFSILLVLPTSWAVYRAAGILFASEVVAATAAILLNATMMVSVETMLITPDSPLLAASAFVLFFLAKVFESGRGAWWLAAGAAVGAALLSKYNALFFGPIILIWLVAVPELRHWLKSRWPYLGGLVALAMFAPVLLWNADHQWVSFTKQFGRILPHGWRLQYLAGFIPGQMLLATPAVFLLGASGLYALHKGRAGTQATAILIGATVWTVALYFGVHSLHAEVHPDYLSMVYPAFAVAAAVAADLVLWRRHWQLLVDFSRRWAVPGSLAMFLLVMIQINVGLLSGNRVDPWVRITAVGFRDVAGQIASIRDRLGASCVLVGDFGTTAWMMFYLPKGSCVAQRNERIRWANMPEPDSAQLRGKLLFVAVNYPAWRYLGHHTRQDKPVAQLERKRGPAVIENYEVMLLEAQTGDVFDRTPPPELAPPGLVKPEIDEPT